MIAVVTIVEAVRIAAIFYLVLNLARTLRVKP